MNKIRKLLDYLVLQSISRLQNHFVQCSYLLAFVGSDSSVSTNVPLQVAALGEGLGALVASEWLLNDAVLSYRRHLEMLQFDMSLQVRLLKICLRTSVAFEGTNA